MKFRTPARVHPLMFLAFLCLFPGCTQFDLLSATVPFCGYSRTSNIPFGPVPRQQLDVYKPANTAPNGPVVIFFYGGHWQTGEKSDYRFVGQALASKGFVAVIPNYRVYPDVTFPAFVEDGARAVRWVHDHIWEFGGDPTRVYLMGHSAGAHIATLLTLDGHFLADAGLDTSAIRATVSLSGPYDFRPGPGDRPAFNMKPDDSAAPDVIIQPIHFADHLAPPLLLIHGKKDEVTDPQTAIKLAEQLTKAGSEARCIIYPDRAHVGVVLALAWSFRWLDPTLKDAVAFFRDH